jgi:hypothetical protein
MDKLAALKTAMDEILDDDRVTYDEEHGIYTVRSGAVLTVAKAGPGEWMAFFQSGGPVPNAPRAARPNEVVAWALS